MQLSLFQPKKWAAPDHWAIARFARVLIASPAMNIATLRRTARAFLLIATSLLPFTAVAEPVLPDLIGNIHSDSQFIPCSRSAEHIVIDQSSHLDPRCTYTGGFEIVASEVEFDCRGATIDDPEGDDPHGVWVHAPTATALKRVAVRNCIIQNFEYNFRVSRDGFKDLLQGTEYRNAFVRIELRNSRLRGARANGVLVDGYVTDVRLRDLEVADSGGAGIYLAGGSRGNRILRSYIHDNGFGDVDPVNGVPIEVGGVEFRYLSTGREGLAIDGSRDNRVARNRFENNSYGAVFLYKNCGELATEDPAQWWPRRYGADDNRIRRNVITNEANGVWVGSRMSQNQIALDCSDPFYVSSATTRIHEDFADGNTVQSNTFTNVGFAIRIEDDGTRVERNTIISDRREHMGITIGNDYRTNVLGRPVTGTTVRGNRANIFLNEAPFVWVHGIGGLVFERNRVTGGSSLIHQVVPPTNEFHLFVKELLAP